MKQISRRKFLQRSMAATAGSYLALSGSSPFSGSARGANAQIRLAVAGINSRGDAHVHDFHNIGGFRVVALCEPDQRFSTSESRSSRRYTRADASTSGIP